MPYSECNIAKTSNSRKNESEAAEKRKREEAKLERRWQAADELQNTWKAELLQEINTSKVKVQRQQAAKAELQQQQQTPETKLLQQSTSQLQLRPTKKSWHHEADWAVTIIQRHWRGFSFRCKAAVKKSECAAVRIQSSWRSFSCRWQWIAQKAKAKLIQQDTITTIKIQRLWKSRLQIATCRRELQRRRDVAQRSHNQASNLTSHTSESAMQNLSPCKRPHQEITTSQTDNGCSIKKQKIEYNDNPG
jgi:hypothetical protein